MRTRELARMHFDKDQMSFPCISYMVPVAEWHLSLLGLHVENDRPPRRKDHVHVMPRHPGQPELRVGDRILAINFERFDGMPEVQIYLAIDRTFYPCR